MIVKVPATSEISGRLSSPNVLEMKEMSPETCLRLSSATPARLRNAASLSFLIFLSYIHKDVSMFMHEFALVLTSKLRLGELADTLRLEETSVMLPKSTDLR